MATKGRLAVVESIFETKQRWEQTFLPLGFELPNGKIDGDLYITRADGSYVTTKSGQKVKEWGNMPQAKKILGTDQWVIYDLINAGIVRAWKLNPHKKYSHWRISLTDCMMHKQRQLKKAPTLR